MSNVVPIFARYRSPPDDNQNEDTRPLQKRIALFEFTDVLRKAMRGIQDVSDHQELAAIVAKLLNEMVGRK